MTNILNFIKEFNWNMKVSSFKNKHTSKESREAVFLYLENKIKKAYDNSDAETFNNVLKVFLERFGITISNSIKDEEEKENIKKLIIFFGEKTVFAIKEHIKNEFSIGYPIIILKELIGEDETLFFLDSIISIEDSLFDDRLVEKRIDILKYFEGKTLGSVLEKALFFLNDSDDRLVIASIRFIRTYEFSKTDNIELIKEKILDKFLDEDTSARIRLELINILIEQEWKISGYKKRIEEILPSGYYITAQGFLRTIDSAVKV